jgi:Bacterial regulatory helix-turn-helix protein, lysR family
MHELARDARIAEDSWLQALRMLALLAGPGGRPKCESALSHQIRQLERELGTSLFERTSRPVTPTGAGRATAARARRVLARDRHRLCGAYARPTGRILLCAPGKGSTNPYPNDTRSSCPA